MALEPLIETIDDAMNIKVKNTEKLAYATQTTLSLDDTKEILTVLKKRFPSIRMFIKRIDKHGEYISG